MIPHLHLKMTKLWSISVNIQTTSKRLVMKRKIKEQLSCWSLSALILIENIMPKTCAHPATESSEEIKMHGNVSITTVSSTLWVCAKLATCRTTTREEPRSRERLSKLKPKLINSKLNKIILVNNKQTNRFLVNLSLQNRLRR
jgi:hypothetical protein